MRISRETGIARFPFFIANLPARRMTEADMHDILKTERLHLRPLTMKDARPFADLANNFAIAKMTSTFPHPFPQRSVEGLIDIFLARAATGRAFHWTILSQGRFVGVVGVTRDGDSWDLGYWLGQPFWGRGYAQEAMTTLLAHLFAGEHRRPITAGVFTDNPASSKLLIKLGFQKRERQEDCYSVARAARQTIDIFDYVKPPQRDAGPCRIGTHTLQLKRSAASGAPSRLLRDSLRARHEIP